MTVRLIPICFLALFAPLLCAAPSGDRITERAVYEDPGGTLTWQQARLKTYSPYSGALTKGFGSSALWIHLRIDSGRETERDEQLVLRMRPNFIETIVFFDPLHDSAPPVAGSIHSRLPGSGSSLNYSFTIPVGNTPREVWLRVTSNTTRTFWVEAVTPEEADLRDSQEEAFIGMGLGLMASIIVWCMVSFLRHPEPLMLRLLTVQTVGLLYALLNLGYVPLLLGNALSPDFLHIARNCLSILNYGVMAWFVCALLLENGVSRSGPVLVMRVSMPLVIVELLLMACGWSRYALQLNSTASTVAPLLGVAMLFAPVRHPPAGTPNRLIPRSLVCLYLALLFIRTNPVLGFTPPEFFAVYGSLLPGLGGGAIMVWVTARRYRLIARAHTSALLRNKLAEQRLDQERRERERQTEFLSMITHELKNPLAVVRMFLSLKQPTATLRDQADQAVVDMAGLVDRCSWIDRLDHESMAVTSDCAEQKSVPGGDEAAPPGIVPCCVGAELSDLQGETSAPSRLRLHVESDLPFCLTDRTLLRVVVANLLDNAIKYALPDSEIEVSVGLEEKASRHGVAVNVRNLPGIAGWPDPKRLFSRYYRAPGARRYIGTGLGLYLAARLTQRLGGDLTYRREATHVVFKLWLPAQTSV